MYLANKATVTIIMLAALLLTGCTYARKGPVAMHFSSFKTEMPKGNRVTICHGYGCEFQTRFRFGEKDLKTLSGIMREKRTPDNAQGERRAIAYAIGWIERRVGSVTGTDKDRPGMEFGGPGDPTQQDCVDEATNTTSYLMVLANNGWLRHHTIKIPFSKGNIFKGVKNWPHWTAVLQETKTKQRYAIDSWIYKNGENPAIVETEKWYIKDLDHLPASKT